MTPQTTRRMPGVVLIAIALAMAAAAAGCADLPGMDDDHQPVAVLEASPEQAWAGDPVTFDGRGSTVESGEIVRWEFDFGDGNTHETEEEEGARVEHVYTDGGVYQAALTVFAETEGEPGTRTATAEVVVTVDERFDVVTPALIATPIETGQSSNFSMEFTGHDGVDRLDAELNVTSALVTGSSEVELRVKDPAGEVIAEEAVAVGPGETVDVRLEAAGLSPGNYTLEVSVLTGSAQAEGELRLLYDADAAGREPAGGDEDEDWP